MAGTVSDKREGRNGDGIRTVDLSFRIPKALLARVDFLRSATFTAAGIKPRRSQVLNAAIKIGVEALEKKILD